MISSVTQAKRPLVIFGPVLSRPKTLDLAGQHICGRPTLLDWDFDGTPEQAYSGLVERRDRWRHPEQLLEEEVEPGWRKAKAE